MDQYDLFLELPTTAKKLLEEFCAYAFFAEETSMLDRLRKLDLSYGKCKSPIEIIYCVAFETTNIKHNLHVELIPQYDVHIAEKNYILDFAIIGSDKFREIKLAVECDGHEFHERTKEQVAYRNRRDMDLQKLGFDILHFSGAEIVEDPVDCAYRTLDYLNSMIKRSKNV